jgi:ribosomal protein S18 acetylase RimI-like enzyme
MADRLDVVIREMRERDLPAVQDLWRDAGLPAKPAGRDSTPALRDQLPHFPTTYLVAEHEGRIVGAILGTHDFRKGWINRLAVHPEYRRLGLAHRLTAACEAALHSLGIEIIAALVERDNEPSAAFFRGTDYRTDVPVHYFRKLRRPDV